MSQGTAIPAANPNCPLCQGLGAWQQDAICSCRQQPLSAPVAAPQRPDIKAIEKRITEACRECKVEHPDTGSVYGCQDCAEISLARVTLMGHSYDDLRKLLDYVYSLEGRGNHAGN
jgi:hypothetical protein